MFCLLSLNILHSTVFDLLSCHTPHILLIFYTLQCLVSTTIYIYSWEQYSGLWCLFSCRLLLSLVSLVSAQLLHCATALHYMAWDEKPVEEACTQQESWHIMKSIAIIVAGTVLEKCAEWINNEMLFVRGLLLFVLKLCCTL